MTGFEEVLALAGEYLTSETVVSAVAAGAAGAATSAALAPSPSAAPAVKPPVPMPDQRAIATARRRSLAEQMTRRGRASTILSDNGGDTLG